jgi:choline dehydrogenase
MADGRPSRRHVLKIGAAASAAAAARVKTAAAGTTAPPSAASPAGPGQTPASAAAPYDFVVVGSGAGGGTVAARLAESGFRVLVLEAGHDPMAAGVNDRPEDYQVPAFHPYATENPSMRWDFWVRHYTDDAQQRRDPKFRETDGTKAANGVWYPRAAAIGGCTAHNAMIFVAPHDSDWNEIADVTGDRSWRAEKMRAYFARIERCHHRPLERLRSRFGSNPSGHGYTGWLDVERAAPRAAVRDRDLRGAILGSARDAADLFGHALRDRARRRSLADPNDARGLGQGSVGLRYTPLSTRNHVRVGARERLLDVRERHPDRLTIETDALVTRVIFEGTRAVGVEYLKGASLYRAHAAPAQNGGERRQVRATREVILAGGTFNTPQLLMLSGVGPRAALEALGITVKVDLPGVGRNLQDRYEVSVVNRMAFDAWEALAGTTFSKADAQFAEWRDKGEGAYITNGGLVSVIAESGPGRPSPDLFCYALLAKFTGYFPGYSKELPPNPNCLSWVVLKGHTNNTAGAVTLRSADPLDPPAINFRYFEEGNDATGDDLRAVVAGVKLVRKMTQQLKAQKLIAREESPGEDVQSDEQIAAFVRNQAWGHHASCTCRIGPRDLGGVVDTNFRVHGTEGLRVVDASVFPRVPGLFIVSAVYMIGEKAADVITSSARGGTS